MKKRLIVIASLLLLFLLCVGCTLDHGFDTRLSSIVKPYRFSLVRWESWAISSEINQWLFASSEEIDDETQVVLDYFSAVERIKILEAQIEVINAGYGQGDLVSLEAELNMLREQEKTLESKVERIIEKQIRQTLAQLGIFNPVDNYLSFEITFPPVNFKLGKLPHLLVISPRDRIESIREIILEQDISPEEIAAIEAAVDELGVSSLVVKIGGMATYPALVTGYSGLRFTINATTEEWLHQYLFFKPLGFLYALDLAGVAPNYEIATMNETLVGMVSKEIGSIVYQNYYSQYETGDGQTQIAGTEFDFNLEMREIRRAVDEYLAQGEIELAEEFMEQKQLYLASKGYYIRKLNQAYFAFHGTYADSPTSISPIGLELKTLSSQSSSINDFLDTVAVMTSRQDLIDSIK